MPLTAESSLACRLPWRTLKITLESNRAEMRATQIFKWFHLFIKFLFIDLRYIYIFTERERDLGGRYMWVYTHRETLICWSTS